MSTDNFITSIEFSIVNPKHCLGTLCKHGHDYQNTGKSLRYKRFPHNCIECKREYDRKFCQEHSELRAEYYNRGKEKQNHRNSHLQRNYGLTSAEYDDMVIRQGDVCAICGQPEISKRKLLHVDHDHVTGKNRGLLCKGCNTGLGYFKDDVELLQRAIKYLNHHK